MLCLLNRSTVKAFIYEFSRLYWSGLVLATKGVLRAYRLHAHSDTADKGGGGGGASRDCVLAGGCWARGCVRVCPNVGIPLPVHASSGGFLQP